MLNTKEYSKGIYVINHELAELWVAKNLRQNDVDYYYGGTRTVMIDSTPEETCSKITYLMNYESGMKNTLINKAISAGVFDEYENRLPKGFLKSCVGGGRCIIQPKTKEIQEIILDVENPNHEETINKLFDDLGMFLNQEDVNIKLTPDFGRFAGLADMLNKYTDNVLGIACDKGGCGGKASYTSTGIVQAIKTLGFEERKNEPVTLIGANGACGIGVLKYLLENGYTDIAICDLSYDSDKELKEHFIKEGCKCLESKEGRYTEECLERGGLIIATTVGSEIEHSNLDVLQENTVLLLAHNEAITEGEKGINFIDDVLLKHNILIIPGQILTFGGALTSRIEWFWRSSNKNQYFDKQLAHDMVSVAANYWITKLCLEDRHANKFRELYDICFTD